ncbi:cytochrome oxidase assembly protein subfamily protein [[Synechococcus] sp. NIES-970]|uniref:COX15/CtaA family protein n=1 Tax=Picosynechococcus sp. NKBG15041c TaxID=1407650 RepID=UPI000416CA5B|nr:heme A synthase [Picosynechococcus sp. NKBG15041c]BAW96570.1 cytochrome oxidase assembly protein subfamily protein [[Synechococcus] sp. NIES-970]
MAHSLPSPVTFTGDRHQVKTWIRRLVWKMAIATFLLMGIGSATRVMNAGLACPDWPLCYGQLVPTQQMNLQVFLEWFHRLDAALIGLSAIALVGLTVWFRNVLPRWLPWSAGFALFLIVFQGILGGLTVTQLLRFDIVTAHLGTALVFFVTLLTIGSCLSDYKGNGTVGKLPWISVTGAILVYVQSLLGGLVASQWAAHQCFFQGDMCLVMHSHIIGVVPATLATLITVILSWRTPALHPVLRYLANTAALLVCLQVAIGVGTYKLHLQVEPLTVTHQAVGAALLGTLVIFSVFALRDRQTVMQLTD